MIIIILKITQINKEVNDLLDKNAELVQQIEKLKNESKRDRFQEEMLKSFTENTKKLIRVSLPMLDFGKWQCKYQFRKTNNWRKITETSTSPWQEQQHSMKR